MKIEITNEVYGKVLAIRARNQQIAAPKRLEINLELHIAKEILSDLQEEQYRNLEKMDKLTEKMWKENSKDEFRKMMNQYADVCMRVKELGDNIEDLNEAIVKSGEVETGFTVAEEDGFIYHELDYEAEAPEYYGMHYHNTKEDRDAEEAELKKIRNNFEEYFTSEVTKSVFGY